MISLPPIIDTWSLPRDDLSKPIFISKNRWYTRECTAIIFATIILLLSKYKNIRLRYMYSMYIYVDSK